MPIVQSEISAEKVSIWNETVGLSRPERALWITNTSGLTLDGGSFSVLEQETFQGEGVIDPIHPGERRLISYATDLAITASSKNASEQDRVTRVRIFEGTMTQFSEIRQRRTYTFRNKDEPPRSIIIEHPVRLGYELRNDVKPEETTSAWMRFRVEVMPKETASLMVDEARTSSFASDLSTNPSKKPCAGFCPKRPPLAGPRCAQRRPRQSIDNDLRRPAARPREHESTEG